MRILYVITGLKYGGAEVQLLELSSRISTLGHEVLVVSILPKQGLAREFEEHGVRVLSLDVPSGRFDPRALTRLLRIIRSYRPTIVHSMMVHANLLTRMCRLFSREPIVINTALAMVESTAAKSSARPRELAYRISDRLSEVTTQVSEACADRYVQIRAVPRQKMVVIPSGVDAQAFHPFSPTARSIARRQFGEKEVFRWLTVGRMVEVKDHLGLIRAFARLRSGSAQLILRGAGPKEAAIRKEVEIHGLTDQVHLLLERCDVAQLMNAADAFVLSSVVEGMSTAALEAAACGLPIVATDVGGNCEVVVDGESGFIVPPRDPDALADAMAKLMSLSKEQREQMGLAGRRLVQEKYDFEIVARQYQSLYEDLLQRTRSRRSEIS